MQFKLWYDADFDLWASSVVDAFDPEDPQSIIDNELVLATVYSGYSIGLMNGFFVLPGPVDDFDSMENVGVSFCLSEVPEEAPEEVVNQDDDGSDADGDEESGDEGEGAVCFYVESEGKEEIQETGTYRYLTKVRGWSMTPS